MLQKYHISRLTDFFKVHLSIHQNEKPDLTPSNVYLKKVLVTKLISLLWPHCKVFLGIMSLWINIETDLF